MLDLRKPPPRIVVAAVACGALAVALVVGPIDGLVAALAADIREVLPVVLPAPPATSGMFIDVCFQSGSRVSVVLGILGGALYAFQRLYLDARSRATANIFGFSDRR